MSWYDMLKCRLYCELLLMLNMSPIFAFYAEGCGVSSAECVVTV